MSDAVMRAMIASVFACGACFAVLAGATFGRGAAAGVALGGLLATVNLAVFVRIGRGLVSRGGWGPAWALLAPIKLFVLFGVAWAILRSGAASVPALAVGYAALPAGLTLATLFGPRAGGGAEPSGSP